MISQLVEAIEAAKHGAFDWTRTQDIGHRAGERDGLTGERLPDGTIGIFKYGPAGSADGRYPYGTRKRLIWSQELQEKKREFDRLKAEYWASGSLGAYPDYVLEHFSELNHLPFHFELGGRFVAHF